MPRALADEVFEKISLTGNGSVLLSTAEKGYIPLIRTSELFRFLEPV